MAESLSFRRSNTQHVGPSLLAEAGPGRPDPRHQQGARERVTCLTRGFKKCSMAQLNLAHEHGQRASCTLMATCSSMLHLATRRRILRQCKLDMKPGEGRISNVRRTSMSQPWTLSIFSAVSACLISSPPCLLHFKPFTIFYPFQSSAAIWTTDPKGY